MRIHLFLAGFFLAACAPDLTRSAGGLDVRVAGVEATDSIDLAVMSAEAEYHTSAIIAALGGRVTVETVPVGSVQVQVSVPRTGDSKTVTAAIEADQRTVVFLNFGLSQGPDGITSAPIPALVHGLRGVQGADDTYGGLGKLDQDLTQEFVAGAAQLLGAQPTHFEVKEVRFVLDSTASAPLTKFRDIFSQYATVSMLDHENGSLPAIDIASGTPPTGVDGLLPSVISDLAPMVPAIRAGRVDLQLRGMTAVEHRTATQVEMTILVKLVARL